MFESDITFTVKGSAEYKDNSGNIYSFNLPDSTRSFGVIPEEGVRVDGFESDAFESPVINVTKFTVLTIINDLQQRHAVESIDFDMVAYDPDHLGMQCSIDDEYQASNLCKIGQSLAVGESCVIPMKFVYTNPNPKSWDYPLHCQFISTYHFGPGVFSQISRIYSVTIPGKLSSVKNNLLR